MKQDFKINMKSIWDFLTLRRVLFEDKNNKTIFDIELIWFLVVLFFFSAIVLIGCIIALVLGYKISLTNSGKNDFINRK